MVVWDRRGILHVVSQDQFWNGFVNGAIQWDSRINGTIVQDGVYTWGLRLFNCTNSTDTFNYYELECIEDHWSLLCFCRVCDVYVFIAHSRRLGAVTVLN